MIAGFFEREREKYFVFCHEFFQNNYHAELFKKHYPKIFSYLFEGSQEKNLIIKRWKL